MVSHFPVLLPDELLYSGIARYHLMSGNTSGKQTIRDLFGAHFVCATVDLPSHLSQLSQKLKAAYSVDTLIREHTLYPYYTAFFRGESSNKIYNLMSENSRWGAAHVALGLAACLIKSPRYLRFCKACYKEDTSVFNEPYWHRMHQIVGVDICHIHKCVLTETEILFTTRNRQFEFVPLVQLSADRYREMTHKRIWEQHLVLIAEHATKLMNLHCTVIEPSLSYRTLLTKRGYITPNGRIRFIELIRDFREFYTDEFLQCISCGIDSTDSWLQKMLRGRKEISHPLRHLLMRIFLGLEVEGQIYEPELPFGRGPWPCLNKAANHYGDQIIEHCKVTRCSKRGVPIGTFSCTCGFVYSRSGSDITWEDRYRIGRIKCFGHEWIQKLNLLNQQCLSLRAKALLLGVDPGTVTRNCSKITLNPPKTEANTFQQEIPIRRARFLVSLKEANVKNILVRRVNAKDYSWLYRHDRAWLFQIISNYKKEQVKRRSTIDWTERDKTVLHEIEKAVRMIKDSAPPQRVTIAGAIRASSREVPVVLDNCLRKLPRTKAFLTSQVETTEQFQIRRLEWAAKEIRSENVEIHGWRLLKMAKLNRPLLKGVELRFNELINYQDSFNHVYKGGS